MPEFFKWLQFDGPESPKIIHMYKKTDAGTLHINVSKSIINVLPVEFIDGRFLPSDTKPITEADFMDNFNMIRAEVNNILIIKP